MTEPQRQATIRPATQADLETILDHRLAMLAAVFPPTSGGSDPAEGRRLNAEWLARHFGVDFSVWIAELDGKPVASAAILWFEHPPSPVNPGGREAYILNVYTESACRRLGLARQLMERLVAEATAAGIRRIWLRASDEGRPLYESMGFGPRNYLELKLG